MSTLVQIQRAMQAGVLDAAAALPASVSIAETSAASSAQRMSVYIHAYRARLIEVLGQDFPGVRALIGEEDFDRLCRAYIDANPSHHFNIRWYGSALADFLRASSSWSANPALAEMAGLEWDIGLSFDAAADSIVDAAAIQAIPADAWPTMRFRLCASLRRSPLHWNVGAIRRAVDRNEAPPPLERSAVPHIRAVYRKGSTVFHRAVEADEAAALDVIAADGTFADICEALCRWHSIDGVAMQALSLFKRWIEEEWIADVCLAA